MLTLYTRRVLLSSTTASLVRLERKKDISTGNVSQPRPPHSTLLLIESPLMWSMKFIKYFDVDNGIHKVLRCGKFILLLCSEYSG